VDPFHAWHRPLALYQGVRAVHAFTGYLLRRRGFQRHTIGHNTLHYWYRPQLDATGAVATVNYTNDVMNEAHPKPLTPLVIVHGVGLGITPYLHFIDRLSRTCGSASSASPGPTSPSSHGGAPVGSRSSPPVFLIELPFISMKMDEHVPAVTDFVRAVTEMLTTHGVTRAAAKANSASAAAVSNAECMQCPQPGTVHPDGAVFIGHSFGTIVSGWVAKRRPQLVHGLWLVSPLFFESFRLSFRPPLHVWH
jgi:hypothetical protein